MDRMSTKQYKREILKHKLESSVDKEIMRELFAMEGRGECTFTETRAEKAKSLKKGVNATVTRVRKGWPDRTVVLAPNGRMLGLELKRAVGGTVSYDQAVRLTAIHKVGGLICIPRSVECFREVLRTGQARQCDLDEIADAFKRGPRVNRDLRKKPIDERTGF